jgi:methylamine dehydrogenase heavy chain
MTAGVSGGWVPGGAQLIGYNKENSILFVGMHPGGKEGSHKDPAKEIWAYDLRAHKLSSRSPVADVISLTATDTKAPVVYASVARQLIQFDANPEKGFALERLRQVYNPGPFNSVVVFRQ